MISVIIPTKKPATRPEATILTSWGYFFDKHVPKTWGNRLAFAWLVAGILAQAIQAAVRERNLQPFRSVRAGLFSLTHGYAGSNFLATRQESGSGAG